MKRDKKMVQQDQKKKKEAEDYGCGQFEKRCLGVGCHRYTGFFKCVF
jgi:hypothetical protein